MQDVEDARALRSAIIDQFEAASLPDLSDEERINMLTFVVVSSTLEWCCCAPADEENSPTLL